MRAPLFGAEDFMGQVCLCCGGQIFVVAKSIAGCFLFSVPFNRSLQVTCRSMTRSWQNWRKQPNAWRNWKWFIRSLSCRKFAICHSTLFCSSQSRGWCTTSWSWGGFASTTQQSTGTLQIVGVSEHPAAHTCWVLNCLAGTCGRQQALQLHVQCTFSFSPLETFSYSPMQLWELHRILGLDCWKQNCQMCSLI